MLSEIEQYEADIISEIEMQADVTTSDAQSIFDAQSFKYMQCLTLDLPPNEAAKQIINASQSI